MGRGWMNIKNYRDGHYLGPLDGFTKRGRGFSRVGSWSKSIRWGSAFPNGRKAAIDYASKKGVGW